MNPNNYLMYRILSFLFFFNVFIANTFAQTFVVNGISYNVVSAVNPFTVEVIAKNPIYTGSITIPAQVTNGGNTYSVIRIGQQAFQNCTGLTSVTMPNSITDIGLSSFAGCTALNNVVFPNALLYIKGYAFTGCTNLEQINLPATVQLINNYAFRGCSSLTTVTIPAAVNTIGISAFAGCSKLTSFNVSAGNTTYKAVNGAILTLNGTIVVQCPAGVSNFVVPTGVTTLANNSFSECSKLEYVFLPNSLTSVSESAFSNCTVLDTIYCNATTPPTVANANAFLNVPANAAIFVPEASINTYKAASHWMAFANTAATPRTFVHNGLKYSMLSTIEPIKVKLIPNTNKYKGNIVIPENINFNYKNYTVTEIRDSAFMLCDSLYSVTMPNSITIIGKYALSECKQLNTVVFSTGLKYILDYAFMYCYSLKEIILPNSLLELGVYAFYSCERATKVSIPASVTKLGNGCFKRLIDLTAFEVDNGNSNYKTHDGVILSKDGTTLVQCPGGLKYLNIPNTVNKIDVEAFAESYIDSVSIPSSVTTIGSYAFFSAWGLKSIVLPGSLKVISESLFYKAGNLESVYLPEGVTKIGNGVFYDCWDLKTLTIPSTVDTIGYYLIHSCTTFYCKAVTPPIISGNTFYNQNKNIPIYVPAGSVAAYKAAPYWSEFTNYNPIPTTAVEKPDNKVFISNTSSSNLIINNIISGNVVEIYNSSGVLLLKKKAYNSHLELNTESLSAGIYIVKLRQPSNYKSFRFIKK